VKQSLVRRSELRQCRRNHSLGRYDTPWWRKPCANTTTPPCSGQLCCHRAIQGLPDGVLLFTIFAHLVVTTLYLLTTAISVGWHKVSPGNMPQRRPTIMLSTTLYHQNSSIHSPRTQSTLGIKPSVGKYGQQSRSRSRSLLQCKMLTQESENASQKDR
jgi:hypothetical protein